VQASGPLEGRYARFLPHRTGHDRARLLLRTTVSTLRSSLSRALKP
jgi:hypothetical protein